MPRRLRFPLDNAILLPEMFVFSLTDDGFHYLAVPPSSLDNDVLHPSVFIFALDDRVLHRESVISSLDNEIDHQ